MRTAPWYGSDLRLEGETISNTILLSFVDLLLLDEFDPVSALSSMRDSRSSSGIRLYAAKLSVEISHDNCDSFSCTPDDAFNGRAWIVLTSANINRFTKINVATTNEALCWSIILRCGISNLKSITDGLGVLLIMLYYSAQSSVLGPGFTFGRRLSKYGNDPLQVNMKLSLEWSALDEALTKCDCSQIFGLLMYNWP